MGFFEDCQRLVRNWDMEDEEGKNPSKDDEYGNNSESTGDNPENLTKSDFVTFVPLVYRDKYIDRGGDITKKECFNEKNNNNDFKNASRIKGNKGNNIIPIDKGNKGNKGDNKICYACKGTDFWMKPGGILTCRRCHPPVSGAEIFEDDTGENAEKSDTCPCGKADKKRGICYGEMYISRNWKPIPLVSLDKCPLLKGENSD